MTNDLTKMGNEELKHYTSLPYRMEIIPDDGAFVARIPDLPGCMSSGETIEDALSGLNEAKELWIEARLGAGNSVPKPSAADSDGWVSVETGERPEIIKRWGGPKDDMYGTSDLLLICSEGIQHTGYYYESGTWSAYWGEILRNVTHYRPLPQPPKKAGKP